MDIRLIRRANLDTLIAEAGTIAELARRTGVSEKYIRQIVSGYSGKGRKSRREIGHDIARRLEDGMNRPTGWLDIEHPNAHKPRVLEAREPSLSADEYELLALWRTLFEEQRTEILAKMRIEAERARRIEQELARRKLDKAIPDGEVAKHLPARPRQRELPIPAPTKKPGKR